MAGSLGRIAPTDFEHVEKYPLTVGTAPSKPVPGILGIDWLESFDVPVKDSGGKWWIAVDEHFKALPVSRLGAVRGGHAICTKPRGATDPTNWWAFYDQDDRSLPGRIKSPYQWKSGGCTGFSAARLLTQLNRVRYDPYFIYHEDQRIDEWPGEDYEGSSVRAALDVLRTQGARPVVRGVSKAPDVKAGISANRWARSTQDFLDATGYGDLDFVDLLNSWGQGGFPHVVRLPAEVLDVLRTRDGELGIVTDR